MADQFQEVLFPVRGLSLTTEFYTQPDLTTVDCLNVRGYEPSTMRQRGGSRPGLVKLIDERVADGYVQMAAPAPGRMKAGPSFLVQHIDLVIDPQADALLMAGDPFNDPFAPGTWQDITDNPVGEPIRNPVYPWTGLTRYLRFGGSGAQPNRNAPPRAANDAISCEVGDGAQTVNVLANDKYTGTPTIVVTNRVRLAGATVSVSGTGASSRIVYTPPSTGNGGTDVIWYKLTATQNTSYSKAALTVTVTKPTENPALGDHHGLAIIQGPDSFSFEFDDDNGDVWTGDWGTGVPILTHTAAGNTFTINLDPSPYITGGARFVVTLTSYNSGTSTYEGSMAPE